VGSGDCDLTRSVSWTATAQICDSLVIWATSSTSCGEEPDGSDDVELGDISASTVNSQGTGTVSFDVNELPFPVTDSGGGCGTLGVEQTFRICGTIKTPDTYGICNTTSVTKLTAITLVYDALPPGKPTIDSVDGLDNALSVKVSAPSGATQVQVEAWRDGAVAASLTQSVDNETFRLRPLANAVTYEVRAFALDAVDNRSESSEPLNGTPVNTRGFYEEYLEAGGQDAGGCGAAGGGLAGGAVLAVMGLWLFSRRGRS
jgi:hypothetical protein